MEKSHMIVFISLFLVSIFLGCTDTENVNLSIDQEHKMLFFGDTSIQLKAINEETKTAKFQVESDVLPSEEYTFSVKGNNTATVSAKGCDLISVTLEGITEEEVDIKIVRGNCIKPITYPFKLGLSTLKRSCIGS